MLIYFLRMSFRHLRLFRTYSLVNVIGLSLGLASSFIVLVYIVFQTSFDRYNGRLDDIYLVTTERRNYGWLEPWTPPALALALKSEIAEVTEAARWRRVRSTLSYKGKVFEQNRCVYSDPSVFQILTLPLVQGDLISLEGERDFLVISESISEKYFGRTNPIGETVSVNCSGEVHQLTVVAVMKDIPRTSTFVADAIGPIHIVEKSAAKNSSGSEKSPSLSWNEPSVLTYVLLAPSSSGHIVENRLLELSRRHVDPSALIQFHLFPLKDIYFHSSTMRNNDFPQGSTANLYTYSTAAVFLLTIACVNYLLLSLGRASQRTRETGIRTVFGARKVHLFSQMVVEATVLGLISLPLALGLVEVFLQNMTDLLGVRIEANYFHKWEFMIAFFTIALGIGTIAGGYVSFYLTRFNPVDTLRNKSAIGSDKSVLRRALMATQMVIFGGLTLSSITIYKQLELFRNGDMGFTSTNLLLLYPDSKGFGRSFDAFKKELMNIPDIESVSGARTLPGSEVRAIMKLPRKNNPSETVSVEGVSVDKDFIETMGIKMVTGASFSDAGTNDSRRECLINESAMNEFGLLHPLGEEIGGLRIIGVVRDFRMHSFREKTSPLIITKGTQSIREVAIRTRLGSAPNTIKSIQDLSKDFNNGKFMEYETFDERLGPLYTQEHKFAKVIGYATGLAIFIACLGVYGMSVLVCHQRVKEIGVRKVLGASLHDIYFMVTREFLGLVLVSTVVALPLTIYFMNKWLQQFAYRTELDLWVFVLAVTIDTAIVLATVTVQATRAAAANPARSLRHE